MNQPKRILIVGATSGIGREVARLYCRAGWRVGIAGRRADRLEALQQEAPEQIETEQIDVTQADAPLRLEKLIQKTGGMDVFLLSSGIGSQNRPLDPATEIATVQTNAEGFTRMVTAAYHYFCRQGYGQLAVISSIAGTKGLGAAPAYSATKRFQNLYIDALEQLAVMEKHPIIFTDIRPGFVRTDLLRGGRYPMQMKPEEVARHIVKAIERKKRRVIIDWRYTWLVAAWKFIPAFIWKRLPIHT